MQNIFIKTAPVSINKMYRGRRFLSKEGKDTKDAIAWEIRSQLKFEPLEGSVALTITFYFKNARMDIDNALKGLLDCMTGLIYRDDRQIVELHVYKKIDKKEPRIEIKVL